MNSSEKEHLSYTKVPPQPITAEAMADRAHKALRPLATSHPVALNVDHLLCSYFFIVDVLSPYYNHKG